MPELNRVILNADKIFMGVTAEKQIAHSNDRGGTEAGERREERGERSWREKNREERVKDREN